MRLSQYNHCVHQDGFHLVYNGFMDTCVVFFDEEYRRFCDLDLTSSELSTMKRLGMIVDDDVDEASVVQFDSRYIDETRRQCYRVYTTTACNARCPYCYEKSMPVQTMDENMADKVCEFIAKNMLSRSSLSIEWFGGEPLLKQSVIQYITAKLLPICEENQIYFSASMVTNGFLIDDKIVTLMKDCRISFVQITLDGTKSLYERIKGYSQQNAFERVLDNIALLIENSIHVQIRLNYNSHNLSDIKSLIELLAKRYGNGPLLNVYCARIMTADGNNSRVDSEETDIELFDCLKVNGFINNPLDTIYHRRNTCVAHMLRSFMILPDGTIGKCSQAMADKDFVGNIDGIVQAKMAKWCTPVLPQKCLECDMLPICNGGCLYERFKHKEFCFASKKMLLHKLHIYLDEYIKSKK